MFLLNHNFHPQIDMDTGKRYLQFLLLVMEFIVMGISLWPAVGMILYAKPWLSTAWQWVLIILAAILIFNLAYLLALLFLRLILPIPKEGYYPKTNDKTQNWNVIIFMLNVLLVILRYRPPWAAYISSLLVNIFPLHYVFRRFFGPDTPSTTLGDTYSCVDPYMIKAGKNVQFGAFSRVLGHIFDNRGLLIKRTEIGDNTVIGGDAIILAGVRIGQNSIIGSGSLVLPNTVIGDYEFWAGIPAKKIRDIPRNHPE